MPLPTTSTSAVAAFKAVLWSTAKLAMTRNSHLHRPDGFDCEQMPLLPTGVLRRAPAPFAAGRAWDMIWLDLRVREALLAIP
eukprot:4737487-Pleurochrysis_carterae.AAC.8